MQLAVVHTYDSSRIGIRHSPNWSRPVQFNDFKLTDAVTRQCYPFSEHIYRYESVVLCEISVLSAVLGNGKNLARKCYVWGERREVWRPPGTKVLVFSCLFRKVVTKSARFMKSRHTLIHEFFLWAGF